MRVKFLTDFRGRETKEQYFRAGDIADLEMGAKLIATGRAVEVIEHIETSVTEADKKAVVQPVQHSQTRRKK